MSEYSASCSEWYVISESGKPAMSTRSTRRQAKSKEVPWQESTEVESYIIASKSDEFKDDQSEKVINELPILIEKLELEESKNIELSQKIEFLEEQNNQLEDLNSSLIEDRVLNPFSVFPISKKAKIVSISKVFCVNRTKISIYILNFKTPYEQNNTLRFGEQLVNASAILNLDSNDNLAFSDFDPKFGTGVHCRNGFIDSEIIIWSIEKTRN